MKLHWEPITLDLKTTFRVAHGASDQRHNVLVYLDDGVGEAAAVPYYGETQEGIVEYLKSVPGMGKLCSLLRLIFPSAIFVSTFARLPLE